MARPPHLVQTGGVASGDKWSFVNLRPTEEHTLKIDMESATKGEGEREKEREREGERKGGREEGRKRGREEERKGESKGGERGKGERRAEEGREKDNDTNWQCFVVMYLNSYMYM